MGAGWRSHRTEWRNDLRRRTGLPEVRGIRVFTWVKNPVGEQTPESPQAEKRDLGLASNYEADHPGMHASPTIDVNVVIDGDLWLVLDNGTVTHLRTGDVVVQNGTRHKWENRTTAAKPSPSTRHISLIGDVCRRAALAEYRRYEGDPGAPIRLRVT